MISIFIKSIFLASGALAFPAFAANPCLVEPDPMERFKCFDLQVKSEEELQKTSNIITMNVPVEKINKSAPIFHLRESISDLSLDGNPASLAIVHSNNETDYKADVALIFTNVFPFPGGAGKNGWDWRAGVEAHRYTSFIDPINSQAVQFGALGRLPLPLNASATTSIGLQWINDRVTETKTISGRIDGLVSLSSTLLDYGIPHSKISSAHAIFPVFGFHLDRVREPVESGTLYGGYIGVKARYYPGYALSPLRFFAEALRIKDLGRNGNLSLRSSTFYKFGVNYVLLDPSPGKFVPSVTLQRTIGSNFLQGIGNNVRTDLIFTLGFN